MIPSAALGNSLTGAGSNAAAGMAASPVAGSAASATQAPGLLGQLMSSRTIGSAVGSAYGVSDAGPTGKAPSNEPPGFNTNKGAVNPNFNQAMGNGNASTPSFGGFNPVQQAQQGGGFNFYSPNGNGTPAG
jgi:hypothetical protein